MSNPQPIHTQWTLDVSVQHHPSFQHRIVAQTLGKHGGWRPTGTWTWTGLGVPEPVISDLVARVSAVIVEHLVMRYGVQGELPHLWAGEPDPF